MWDSVVPIRSGSERTVYVISLLNSPSGSSAAKRFTVLTGRLSFDAGQAYGM